jgi:hypothetical protein
MTTPAVQTIQLDPTAKTIIILIGFEPDEADKIRTDLQLWYADPGEPFAIWPLRSGQRVRVERVGV